MGSMGTMGTVGTMGLGVRFLGGDDGDSTGAVAVGSRSLPLSRASECRETPSAAAESGGSLRRTKEGACAQHGALRAVRHVRADRITCEICKAKPTTERLKHEKETSDERQR